MKTSELLDRLRKRYSDGAYALITEVGNSTGFQCNRHADALVMSLWPSRGLHLTGCELKVSRADWLKELKQPEKAEDIFGFCDYWYVVVSDSKIVQPGELPPTWGLLAANGDGIKVITEAPKLSPKSITRSFLAAIMRRVNEQTADIVAVNAAREAGRKAGSEEATWRHKQNETDLAELREKVRKFEAASGINLDYRWEDGRKVGQAVARVLAGEDVPQKRELERIRLIAAGVVAAIDREFPQELPATSEDAA